MSVCGHACAKVRMGGGCGRFNKAMENDRCENAMGVRDPIEAGRFPGLQLIAVMCADLGVALGEADTVHLSSLWKRRSAWSKSRERSSVAMTFLEVGVGGIRRTDRIAQSSVCRPDQSFGV
jgi:hypothetical protein